VLVQALEEPSGDGQDVGVGAAGQGETADQHVQARGGGGIVTVVGQVGLFDQPDYLLWVAVPDPQACERFLMTELIGLPGMARTNSQFPMKTIKSTSGLAIPFP
jgi:hypothetical protein